MKIYYNINKMEKPHGTVDMTIYKSVEEVKKITYLDETKETNYSLVCFIYEKNGYNHTSQHKYIRTIGLVRGYAIGDDLDYFLTDEHIKTLIGITEYSSGGVYYLPSHLLPKRFERGIQVESNIDPELTKIDDLYVIKFTLVDIGLNNVYADIDIYNSDLSYVTNATIYNYNGFRTITDIGCIPQWKLSIKIKTTVNLDSDMDHFIKTQKCVCTNSILYKVFERFG